LCATGFEGGGEYQPYKKDRKEKHAVSRLYEIPPHFRMALNKTDVFGFYAICRRGVHCPSFEALTR